MHHFPKSVCLVLTVTLTTVLSVSSLAYQNEPYEFRGIAWGTPITELLNMVPVLQGADLTAYTREGDKMRIGNAELNKIHYIFYKGEFYCVHVGFEGLSNFDALTEIFIREYGRPPERQYTDRHYHWEGDRTSISLDYDASTEKGEIGYKYMPIQRLVDQEEKNAARNDAARAEEEEEPGLRQ